MKRFTTGILVMAAVVFGSIPAFADDTIQINPQQYDVDVNLKLVLTNLDVTWVNATWTNPKTHIFLNEPCTFSTAIHQVEAGKPYDVFIPSYNSVFTLYFTELPILSISTPYEIVDEPYVQAHFRMIETNQAAVSSFIGIQYRGGWTQTLPKKSMEIEFWSDSTGAETQDVSLLGLRTDDDWNLQAMYNEPLRIRSKTNNDLWLSMHRIQYQQSEPDAMNGIRMKYAELFLNHEYQGVYCVGEKIDRKQLRLKNHNGTISGELYKGAGWDGATTFHSLPPYSNNSRVWGGFEYKHPDEETDWANLHGFVDFVINAPDHQFYEEYDDRFEIDNLVDYFIFLNLLRATDNTGKNIYIAKYNANEKYFYAPWDLDGTYGSVWDGSYDPTTNGILLNGFYSRLMYDCQAQGFRDKLKARWLELRSTHITYDSILSMFMSSHELLLHNGVYERESLRWPNFTYNSWDIDYISDWLSDRLEYLDGRFTEECIPLSDGGIIADKRFFTIFPNPTNDVISIITELSGPSQIAVYNYLGQLVLKELIAESTFTISLGHLEKGIFFIEAKSQDFMEVHKVILTH